MGRIIKKYDIHRSENKKCVNVPKKLNRPRPSAFNMDVIQC